MPRQNHVSMDNSSSLRMIDYNENSQAQNLGSTLLTTIIKKHAKLLRKSISQREVVNICEYGCATGGSSIAPIRAIQDELSPRKIRIFMNDLPANDWAALKNVVESTFPDINFFYIAKSMYGAVVGEASVHLGYSCFAQHWLEHGAPVGLPGDALWANQRPLDCSNRKQWEAASRKNWEKKLLARSREIVPGGKLILHIQSAMNDGSLLESFADTLKQAKRSMIKNRELSLEKAMKMYIPEYPKTPAEIMTIACAPNVSSLWRLVEAYYCQLPVGDLDKQTTVDKQIKLCRAFMDSSLLLAVNNAELSIFWRRVKELACDDPTLLSHNYMATFLCFERI